MVAKRGSPVRSESNPDTNEYANVIRTLIAHEDLLLNSRTNWFILIQGLLFAAFSGIHCNREITFVLASVGIVISISFFVTFKISERAIGDILNSWDKHLKKYNKKWEDYPPVIGINLERHKIFLKLHRFLSPRKILPWVFTVAWIVICIFNIVR